MKSFVEMHQETWKTTTSKWSFRIFLAMSVFMMVGQLVLVPLASFYDSNSIQTWGAFFSSWLQMKQGNLDLAVPSSHQFWSMTWASSCQLFVETLLGGMIVIGLVSLAVKAVRGDDEGWFGSAFGGFKSPLEMLWLNLLKMLMLSAWVLPAAIAAVAVWALASRAISAMQGEVAYALSVLLVADVAALVLAVLVFAMLRYALAWYVKADNPDYSAWSCLSESVRMMQGHKLELLAYWLTFALLIVPTVAAMVVAAALVSVVPPAGVLGAAVVLALLAFTMVYMTIGFAVFYDELKRISENKTVES